MKLADCMKQLQRDCLQHGCFSAAVIGYQYRQIPVKITAKIFKQSKILQMDSGKFHMGSK